MWFHHQRQQHYAFPVLPFVSSSSEDDEVDVLSEDGEWYQINYNGKTAYVKSEYVYEVNYNDLLSEEDLEIKKINYVENLNSDYIHITSSNDIEFPNDRILLEDLPNKIKFRNVKTNSVSTKDISTLRLVGINKIYNVNEFYKNFYNILKLTSTTKNKML